MSTPWPRRSNGQYPRTRSGYSRSYPLAAARPGSLSTDAFVQRLHELGWIGNRTVAIEYRWGEGRDERFSEIAAEFVRLKVDVILTYATPSSIAAKKATAIIPIVFAAAGDPVGTGPVASLVRPGGNITGLSQDRFAGSRFAKSQILKILEQCVFKHLLGFEWHVRSYHLQSD